MSAQVPQAAAISAQCNQIVVTKPLKKNDMAGSVPSVSICIPNYNYCRYLKYALDSALAQSWKDIEVLVVDDRSEDDSVTLVEEYTKRDERVVLHSAELVEHEIGARRQAARARFSPSRPERSSGSNAPARKASNTVVIPDAAICASWAMTADTAGQSTPGRG